MSCPVVEGRGHLTVIRSLKVGAASDSVPLEEGTGWAKWPWEHGDGHCLCGSVLSGLGPHAV